MPRFTVGGRTFSLHPSGPRNWGKEGNEFAEALTDQLAEIEAGAEDGVVIPDDLVNDGTTDNYEAIQDAYDSLAANETLRIPAGNYSVHKPLIFDKSQVNVEGAGRRLTFLTNSTGFGGAQILKGPDEDPIATALIGGVPCMDFKANTGGVGGVDNAYLNLRESYLMEWGDRTNFCWEFRFKTGTLTVGTEEHIFSAQGVRFTTVGRDTCFKFYTTIDKELRVICLINGVVKTLFSSTVLSNNTDYEVRVDYNGSALALLINGTPDTSTSASGGLTLYRHCMMALGGEAALWPYAMSFYNEPSAIYLRSCRFGATRGQTAYTAAPTSLYSADNLTHLALDFDETHGPCTIGYGTNGSTKVYFRAVRPTQGVEVFSSTLSNIGFNAGSAGAVYAIRARQCRYENISMDSGRYCLLLHDNCYNSVMKSIAIIFAQDHPFFGIFNGWASGPNYIENLEITGGKYGLVNRTSSLILAGANYINGCSIAGVYSGSQTAFDKLIVTGLASSDENASAAFESSVMLDGPAGASFIGCTFELSSFDSPLVVVDSKENVSFSDCLLIQKASGTEPLVKVMGGDAQNEVKFSNCQFYNSSTHPRAEDGDGDPAPGHVVFDSDFVSGAATVEDANTSVDVEFDEEQPDTAYRVVATASDFEGFPAAGSRTVYVSDKTTAGFTLNVETAPGVGDSVTFDWSVTR